MVVVGLEESPLWDRFNRVQNEMIITRNGRCLFPLLKLSFTQMDNEMAAITYDGPVVRLIPGHRYAIGVTIAEADTMRWRYRAEQWQPVLSAEYRGGPSSESTQSTQSSSPIFRLSGPSARRTQVYEPVSYMTAEDMILHGVSFSRIKLSNRPQSEGDRVQSGASFALYSFRRYIPVIFLYDHDMRGDPRSIGQVLLEEPDSPSVIKFSFPSTNFIAVTHYQNELVTTLKKSFNPHAKGFLVRSPKRYQDDEATGETEEEDDYEEMSSSLHSFEDMSQSELLATQTLMDMSMSPVRHRYLR